eukprot:TRINITY_DN14003_c0_g1_i1.p1 TRINITY_DN14003_c0_g1~~TRINITY_DN14003_c0_g1_i1.p1  ORF type:complete len:410 (+),score=19.12 TRINITY_DN14003_c0_g1_i1:46-1230(+)
MAWVFHPTGLRLPFASSSSTTPSSSSSSPSLPQFTPTEFIDGALVFHADGTPPGALSFDYASLPMPAVHAAYCDGVTLQCVSRNMDPPYWFGLPDTCLLPNLRSVNLPGIPARLVFSGMNFMCIFPGKSSSSAASPNDGRDNVNVIEPLRNPPLTNVDTHNIFAFLEANEHAWQYGPQSDNTPLAYYCARRLAVATRVGHPKIWWFSVAFGNYAYATGSWELAQNSLMGLKRYLGIEKGRWRPLAADASQTPNRVDGYAVSARCQWWVVAVKLILLELDKQLLRGDLEGVKGVLRQFFTLVVENVMFIKEYHIVWAMQVVYSALIVFPLDNFVDEVDDEVEGLVRWMEDMWGGRMSMLSTHPGALPVQALCRLQGVMTEWPPTACCADGVPTKM